MEAEQLTLELAAIIRGQGYDYQFSTEKLKQYWFDTVNGGHTTCPDCGGPIEFPDDLRGVTTVDYETGERSTVVREDMDEWHTLRTTAHELSHIMLGHTEQVYYEDERPVLEIEAEMGAFYILNAFGLVRMHEHTNYLRTWENRLPWGQVSYLEDIENDAMRKAERVRDQIVARVNSGVYASV